MSADIIYDLDWRIDNFLPVANCSKKLLVFKSILEGYDPPKKPSPNIGTAAREIERESTLK